MNSLHESVRAAAARILSQRTGRPRAMRSRRFRPLAEPMEARAVLSQLALPTMSVGPEGAGPGASVVVGRPQPSFDVASADAGTYSDPGAADPSGAQTVIVVDGQVEIQPDQIASS
jgi:hypothetical protein